MSLRSWSPVDIEAAEMPTVAEFKAWRRYVLELRCDVSAAVAETDVWKREHTKVHGDWLETRKKVEAAEAAILEERKRAEALTSALEWARNDLHRLLRKHGVNRCPREGAGDTCDCPEFEETKHVLDAIRAALGTDKGAP